MTLVSTRMLEEYAKRYGFVDKEYTRLYGFADMILEMLEGDG